jgi:ABC-2 type transport system permease protein
MRAIFTIAWKDIKNLLSSPLFYVISGLCSVLWSYSYMRNLIAFAEKSRMYGMQGGADGGMNLQGQVFLLHISQINLLLVFVVPAFTMRLLAEEKKLRTYDLLLTSPITATQIAVGKFLAGLGSAGALIGISFFYPLMTRMVAEYQMAPLISAYVGVLFVAAVYVGVGLFASALTESVMLSVVMGLIFNISLWFISQGADAVSNPQLSAVLEYMSFGQHFLNFIIGSIKLSSLVFMFSVIGLFIFLTQRVIESSRWR